MCYILNFEERSNQKGKPCIDCNIQHYFPNRYYRLKRINGKIKATEATVRIEEKRGNDGSFPSYERHTRFLLARIVVRWYTKLIWSKMQRNTSRFAYNVHVRFHIPSYFHTVVTSPPKSPSLSPRITLALIAAVIYARRYFAKVTLYLRH